MKKISAEEFDRKFDEGEDILPYIDLSSKMTKSEFEKKLLSIKKVKNKPFLSKGLISPFPKEKLLELLESLVRVRV